MIAEEWRKAAENYRRAAAECDRRAEEAEAAGESLGPEVVRLLYECDGQLGLAIHRGEGKSAHWLKEAEDLRGRIRKLTERLG